MIREYKEGDEKGIFALWKSVFGNLLEKNDIFEIGEDWWNWRVLKNPEGFPKIYLAFSETGEVIAHHMIEKLKFSSKDGERVIYQGSLTMADEKNRGLTLLKLLNQSIEHVKSEGALEYGFPNDNANQLYQRLGWKDLGNVPVLGRPLSSVFKIFDLSKDSKNYEIKNVEIFNEDINKFTTNIKNMFKYSMKRDQKTLNWKYVQNPLKHYEKRVLIKNGSPEGYCVFRCGKFGGKKTGIILDILAKDREEFNVLLDEIIKYFVKEKMKFISCYMIDNNFFYGSLLRRGFIRIPISMLPKKNTIHLINNESRELLNIKNWYLSYGDWDCV